MTVTDLLEVSGRIDLLDVWEATKERVPVLLSISAQPANKNSRMPILRTRYTTRPVQ